MVIPDSGIKEKSLYKQKLFYNQATKTLPSDGFD